MRPKKRVPNEHEDELEHEYEYEDDPTRFSKF